MEIPLTTQEVELVTRASALVNRAYGKAFNTIAATSGDENTPDLRQAKVQLISLEASKDTLRDIRHDLAERPYLTDGHLSDLSVLKDTVGAELAAHQTNLIIQSPEWLDKGFSAEQVLTMRHDGMSDIEKAKFFLDQVFTMIDSKLAAAQRINNGPADARGITS